MKQITMKPLRIILLPLLTAVIGHVFLSAEEPSKTDDSGFVQIFDGKTLDGWEGDPVYWRVEGGHLVGEITPETIVKRNTFIIWKKGTPADFELKLEYRITENGNSGVNYRSERLDDHPFALTGYQADIDGKNRYTGQNYEERGRTTLAYQGQVTTIPPIAESDLKKLIVKNAWTPAVVVESLGEKQELAKAIKSGDWNRMRIVAKGNSLQHYVNDVLLSDVTDKDPQRRRMSGLIGMQVHVGPPMKVEYREILLNVLEISPKE
jgi:hypothetical protein